MLRYSMLPVSRRILIIISLLKPVIRIGAWCSLLTNIIIIHETQLALAVIGWAALLVSILVVIRVKHMVVIDLGLDLGKYQLFGGCVMSRKTWPKEAPSIKISPQIYYDTHL